MKSLWFLGLKHLVGFPVCFLWTHRYIHQYGLIDSWRLLAKHQMIAWFAGSVQEPVLNGEIPMFGRKTTLKNQNKSFVWKFTDQQGTLSTGKPNCFKRNRSVKHSEASSLRSKAGLPNSAVVEKRFFQNTQVLGQLEKFLFAEMFAV